MPKGDIVEGQAESRTVWQMRDDHGVRDTTVFMDHDEVRDFVCAASLDEFLHDVVSSVYSIGVGEDQTQFLLRVSRDLLDNPSCSPWKTEATVTTDRVMS